MALFLGPVVRKINTALTSIRYISTGSTCFGARGLTKTNIRNGMKSVVLSDPKTRNCLSVSMMEDIIEDILVDQNNFEVRCIVISAEGPVFSSGHNLKELAGRGKEGCAEIFAICSTLMNAIADAPVPIVAAVDGVAAAAGCQLVAACDLAVCTQRSTFSTPGASWGLFCSTPGIPLARAVPRKVAAHMLFTGLPISAEVALRAGLVSSVVDDGKLDEEVAKVVESISKKSRDVLALGKKFFYQQIEMDLCSAYRLGESVMVGNIGLPDGQEGLKSFAEKRQPQWKESGGGPTSTA
ncbi:enoyl-CoA hydratase domain-containing protein 3, mitochondrial [Ischnura elegans]|uniref:enoyl-CoA hydratase domain-containing protein 3, mitochondrial n=1 Tax=Ischnura elegans TaxID=197161 RepID=UPI001ED8723D|nr:enoyl-CoA hydratase domain-containing protein 3, mitochondrial [Ischnura elegans]